MGAPPATQRVAADEVGNPLAEPPLQLISGVMRTPRDPRTEYRVRVVLLLLASAGGVGFAFSAKPARINERPLRGVTGYSTVVVAHPRLARKAGIDTTVLQASRSQFDGSQPGS